METVLVLGFAGRAQQPSQQLQKTKVTSIVTLVCYNGTQAGTRDQAGLALKFTVPTIANGGVFVSTATELGQ